MLEKGSVKYFNGADKKRFGFIIPEGKNPGEDDVFFHYNGFRKFEAKGGQVVFSKTGYGHPAAFPKNDEQVWFVRGVDHRMRPVAEPWGYNHDYKRVQKEIADRPHYGDNFVYISLCEGNLPRVSLENYGTLTRIPEDQREKYEEMMWNRGFNGRCRFTRVIPNPGMEKKIGRIFRHLSYEEGPLGLCHKSIEVVEIPKEYEYGKTEREIVLSARCLSVSETRMKVGMGKPMFTRSDYFGTWHRIIGFYENVNGDAQEVSVALTPVRGWDEVKKVNIYVTSPGHNAEKHEGPFTILPDSVKDDMEEVLGAEIAHK